jgi:hypothetical protein
MTRFVVDASAVLHLAVAVAFATGGCALVGARPSVSAGPDATASESLTAAPTQTEMPTETPAESPTVEISEKARTLLATIPLSSTRRTDGVEVVFPGAATLDIPASPDAVVTYDYWSTGTWITVAEPADRTVDLYDVDRVTNAVTRIGQLTNVDETLSVGRSKSGTAIVAGGVDFGVVRLDLSSGELAVLVSPGPPSDLPGPFERAPFHWSPTGQTLVSAMCNQVTCVSDVIDVTTWTSTRIVNFVTQASTDEYLLGYSSREDPGWRVFDLANGNSDSVAPEVAAAYDGYARDDGRFTLYGATSWAPEVPPVRRPVFEADPTTLSARLVADQDPTDWGYLFRGWTTPDWVLLVGQNGGLYTLVDSMTGDRTKFHVIDGAIELR